uniref:BTB domain-containing protein n=1 Tax=Aplanochytrium stocchinoi TaxID=215587 RepID=A0A7S3PRQ4_9STRA
MQYMYDHYEEAVAGRNRTVVETLGNTHQELLAEIVALASDNLAGSNISKLPRISPPGPSKLVANLGSFFNNSPLTDVVIIPYAFEELDSEDKSTVDQVSANPSSVKQSWHIGCHKAILVARSPVFAKFFHNHYHPAPEAKQAEVSLANDSDSMLNSMFVGTTVDNNLILREVTESSPAAIR